MTTTDLRRALAIDSGHWRSFLLLRPIHLGVLSVGLGVVALLLAPAPPARYLAGSLAVVGLGVGASAWRAARSSTGTRKELAGAGIVLAGLAGAGLLASTTLSGPVVGTGSSSTVVAPPVSGVGSGAPEPAEQPAADVLGDQLTVSVGKLNVSMDTSGLPRTSLPITVTNVSEATRSFDVDVVAVGKGGARIGDDTASIRDLAPGRGAEASVFNLVSERFAKRLKRAEFTVADATSY